MDKFINDWGTEVALAIAIIGAIYIIWLTWPERKSMGLLWRLVQLAGVLAGTALGIYGYLALNGVML
jgi:hypothetical protein